MKPFSPKELVLRVRALLRRSGTVAAPKEIDGRGAQVLTRSGIVRLD